MSAIIAGKSCIDCGQKYWLSFGAPEWWKRVVMNNQPPCEIYKIFDGMRRSGRCPRCWCLWMVETDLSSVPDEQLEWLAFIFWLED